jgi:hypothetical protein
VSPDEPLGCLTPAAEWHSEAEALDGHFVEQNDGSGVTQSTLAALTRTQLATSSRGVLLRPRPAEAPPMRLPVFPGATWWRVSP